MLLADSYHPQPAMWMQRLLWWESARGGFVEGKMSGKGVLSNADGTTHEGDCVKGKQHGQGVSTNTDGSRYEGGWEHGKQHGKGGVYQCRRW
jgi:hypothetical protein